MLPLFLCERTVTMNDDVITIEELYLQDIICDIVFANPREDDIVLYNKIANLIDVETMGQTIKILELIKMNKLMFNT